jgi:hypothetical protein
MERLFETVCTWRTGRMPNVLVSWTVSAKVPPSGAAVRADARLLCEAHGWAAPACAARHAEHFLKVSGTGSLPSTL